MDSADRGIIAQVGPGDIVIFALLITGAAILAYIVYRAMERPRLRLVPTPDGERTTTRDAVLYAVTIPVLVIVWYLFFFLVLLLAQNDLDAWSLIAVPAAIIMSARLLAHINKKIAYETAKVVPLTLLTLIIISGRIRDDRSFAALADDVDRIEVTIPAIVLILVFDYVVTATWYWGWIRWQRPIRDRRRAEAERLRQEIAQDDGGVAVLADSDRADRRT